jgi:hypothetical protein
MKTKLLNLTVGLLAVVCVVFLTSGCDSDLVDINNSPNATSAANVKTIIGQQAILVGLQAIIGDWYAGDRSRVTSIWVRQMCRPDGLGRAQPGSWQTYAMSRGSGDVIDYSWRNGYYAVRLANDIIDNASDAGLTGGTLNLYLGMAKFYKALVLGENAALWGSIPVETRNTVTPHPVFVSQTAAYAAVQTLLDEALVHFNAGTATEARDLNFAGNQALWVAATNSLKARYYLHTMNYSSAATSASSGITAAAGSVFGRWTTSRTSEYSPWGHWCQTETGEPLRGNKYYVDLLKSEAGDTRLNSFFLAGTGAATIVGHDVYGDLGGTGDELIGTRAARVNNYRAYNAPFPLISYQENLLIRAEAVQRGAGAAVSSEALGYLNTIRTGAGLTSKVAGDFANGTAVITEILKQKYLQLFLEGQAYHDMRRVASTDGRAYYRANIPHRYFYTQTEINTNPNVPADPLGLYQKNELWP